MKMKFVFPFIVMLLTGFTACFSPTITHQVYPETQVKGDTLVHFKSTTVKPKQINDSLIYYWTKFGKVNTTKGHYGGRLLQDEYIEMVGNLIIKSGFFKEGLKAGKWKTWEGKNLRCIYNWKNGVLDGDYTLFDEQGNIIEKGSYRNGMKKDEE
ncbi:MAG TPA: hypothetical protein DG754_06440 [Bacteroidales bacterium]|jgi:antitoxin component YwqK of YwqJK toxin-antitoxin module|nr:hypothetical protein [Bacteroidales bacterium]